MGHAQRHGVARVATHALGAPRSVGLPDDSTDREVWRFAQANQMLLLTNNRNMEGVDMLEQIIRDEGHVASLPVITIGRAERMSERTYREQCATRLLEIVIDYHVRVNVHVRP